jgi:hypothetical protein
VTNELLSGGKLVIVYTCGPLHAPSAPLSTASDRHELGRALLDELMLEGDEELLDIDFATEVSEGFARVERRAVDCAPASRPMGHRV